MGSIIDFGEILADMISAGSEVEGNVVKIIADNGDEIGDAVFKVVQGGNGTATEVGVATQTGATGTVATGLAYLGIDLGVAGAAIAPALGIAAGVGLYNLAPEFWNDVSEKLVDAGKTVGGKVIAYWDGFNSYFDEDVIEVFKQALIDANVFYDETVPAQLPAGMEYDTPDLNVAPFKFTEFSGINLLVEDSPEVGMWQLFKITGSAQLVSRFKPDDPLLRSKFIVASENSFTLSYDLEQSDGRTFHLSDYSSTRGIIDNFEFYYTEVSFSSEKGLSGAPANVISTPFSSSDANKIAYAMLKGSIESNPDLEPGATYPSSEPFPLTYPDWLPIEYPQTLPNPSELPVVYPIKYPGTEPDAYPDQDPAQNPQPESWPDTYPVIMPDFALPDPGIPTPPEPTPDPDPEPAEPDPLPDNPDPETVPDPIDPNTPPTPTPAIPVVLPPSTVDSNKLFTVYNPSASQLDALGGYLWDSSIIAAIRDIWQEPMDGLISLQQIFVTPVTSGSHNIILGFLDSGVSAPVVSNQFVDVDCGTVSVKEKKKNATDYAPYTSLHLYLPFIGIVELDTNECMDADISVKYRVDVYTGTCLATVSVDRDIDMPDGPILYTFSGNCSQQLPLTSGNSTGVLSALLAGVGVGVSVASGGGLSTVAGYHLAGSSLTHEMMHVSHSGNISANAGIMGNKKPYLIIGRRHGYDANNYNSYYGYPANKTVVLGNHTGYVKVKSCYVKTSATKQEYEEIQRLLEEGVFL